MPDPKPNRADYVYCATCAVLVPKKYLRTTEDDFFSDETPRTVCPEGHPVVVEGAS